MAQSRKPRAPRNATARRAWIARQKTRIGACIRAHREQRGMTRAEAARAAGVHPMHLAKIELGRANVTLATLASLALGFGEELRAFFNPPPNECA